MMPSKQLVYQQKLLAAGKCRRGCKRPRQIKKDGTASVFCEFCRAADNDARAAYRRRNRRPAPTPAPANPAPTPTPTPTDAPLNDAEARRMMAIAQGRCAECRRALPYERGIAGIEFCTDCQPSIC